jgi:hypothetical protein
MPYRWEDRHGAKEGVRQLGLMGHAVLLLGVVFALLGIIADAACMKLGLSATSWLLLSIAAFACAITFFVSWGVCWYLSLQEPQK